MSQLQARIDEIRRNVLDAVDRITAAGAEDQLPAPPDALAECRRRLAENTYQVLVAGEVKRGKSSFINALIGRDVLPTDVDVATSQVFRVSRAEREAYRLRFEDGSAREISRDDLARYGSQVVADAEGTPRLDQLIRWIEVDVPVRFLPVGLSILDTPGLGGLYSFHAEITRRFIPHADAVIFVLDSTRPIGAQELAVLEEILAATRDVFFVQTRIDQFRTQQWQEVRQRNETILRERFGDRLTDSRVWPISSQLLRAASAQDDPDFEIASRHRELAPALQEFLFRSAGWTRSAAALILASEFHAEGGQVLAARHRDLVEESRQHRNELGQELARRSEEFAKAWGEHGVKRGELKAVVKRLATLGKAQISQVLGRGGDLETALLGRVAAADSIDALRSLSERLADSAAASAMRAWREVTDRSWAKTLELLAPFLQEASDLTAPWRAPRDGPNAPAVPAPPIQRDWYARMKGARLDFMTGAWAGGLGGGILITLGLVAFPAAAVATLLGGCLAALRGARSVDQTQLRAAQQDVSRHVGEICRQIRRQFLEVDLVNLSFSPVDEFFQELEQIADEQITTITRRKTAEANAEIARIRQDAELTDQQRTAEATRIRQRMAHWTTLGVALRTAEEELRHLDKSVSAQPDEASAG